MNFPRRSLTATVVTLSLIGLVGNFQLSQATAAYSDITLGSAGNYMILAGTAITNGAGTHLDGDASLVSGISPTLAGAGIADSLIASGSSRFDDGGDTATAAQVDLGRAIEFIESLTVTTSRPVIADETFTAGVYGTESGVALSIGGVITLDGGGDSQSVFIFRTGSALDFLAATSIVLTGGTQPANVYWVAGSALTLGAASTVSGNVIALSALTIGASSIVTGALLTQGAITIGAGTSLTHKALIPIVIVVPPVVVPPAPEPIIIAPDQPPVIFPTITPEPTPTPTVEPIVEVTVPPEPIIVATPTLTPTPEITTLPIATAPPTPSAELTHVTPQTSQSPLPIATEIAQVTPTPVSESQTPEVVTPEVLTNTPITRESFSPYSPIDHPRDTAKTAVEAFAVLALVTSGAATTQGFLAQVARGGVLVAGVHLGRGDRRRARKSKSYGKPINFFTSFATAISSASPLAARTVSDASYLRASLGSLSLLLYPASIALGAFAAVRVNFQSLPPSIYLVFAMMALGIADAMAGLIAGIVFSIAIATHGNVRDLKSLLTLAGIVLLTYSPGILAGTFRPLRRYVDNFRALWERSTDYIIASILAGWVVKQIAVGLPGLSGLDLPIATHANELGIAAGLLVGLRFAAEDSVSYFLPGRIRDLEPEYKVRNLPQKLMTGAVQIAVFAAVAQPFIGWNVELWLGLAIFVTPMVLALVSDFFPKSSLIRKWLPTGVIEIILIALSGYFITQILVNQNYPATKFILVAFVILSLPGLLIKLFQIFAGDYEHHWRDSKKGYFIYELAGLLALATLIYIVFVGF